MKKILVIAMVLALLAVLAVPLVALADGNPTGTTDVTGNVPSYIEVTAPDGFSMPSLVPGTTVNSPSKTAHVTSNFGWTLSVHGSNGGQMATSPPAAAASLANAIKMQGGNNFFQLSPHALTGADQTLATGNPTNTFAVDFTLQQQVAITDAPGDYSILITFTGTPTP